MPQSAAGSARAEMLREIRDRSQNLPTAREDERARNLPDIREDGRKARTRRIREQIAAAAGGYLAGWPPPGIDAQIQPPDDMNQGLYHDSTNLDAHPAAGESAGDSAIVVADTVTTTADDVAEEDGDAPAAAVESGGDSAEASLRADVDVLVKDLGWRTWQHGVTIGALLQMLSMQLRNAELLRDREPRQHGGPVRRRPFPEDLALASLHANYPGLEELKRNDAEAARKRFELKWPDYSNGIPTLR